MQPEVIDRKTSSAISDIMSELGIGSVASKLAKVTRLAFEGGGAHVACSLGVLRGLEKAGRGDRIAAASGASAGALLASCVAMGAGSAKIEEILSGYDWGKIGRFSRVFHRFTPWRSHPLDDLARYVIESCGYDDDVTLGDIMWDDRFLLIISVSDEGSCVPLRLSYSNAPNLTVRECIVASMSVPYVFPPVKLGPLGDVFSDGGLSDNFPIDAFENCDPETVLGVRIDPPRQIARSSKFPFSRAVNLLKIVRGVADRAHVPDELWPRVVRIEEPGFSFLDFDEMSKRVDECIELGNKALVKWEAK